MYDPLVSIIIPVYNAEKYLDESIGSAISQTWKKIEIIIVDDGSADQSLNIALKYQAEKIKVFHQENKGASAARNRGLLEANGDYIQFLDADDLLSENKIADQITALEGEPEKIANCSTVHFYDGTFHQNSTPSQYEEKFLFDDDDPVHFLITLLGGYSANGSMVQTGAWLTPKSIISKIGGWNEKLTTDDDGEFFCRVILNSKGIIKTNGYSYYRKQRSAQSLSSQKNLKSLQSSLAALLLKRDLLLSVNNSFEAKAAIYKALINLAAQSYLKYPGVYSKATAELPKIKMAYRPPMGSSIAESLTAIFGWKMVALLKKAVLFYR
jgi:glycosyltransferase involved in cell wall biosynthesis